MWGWPWWHSTLPPSPKATYASGGFPAKQMAEGPVWSGWALRITLYWGFCPGTWIFPIRQEIIVLGMFLGNILEGSLAHKMLCGYGCKSINLPHPWSFAIGTPAAHSPGDYHQWLPTLQEPTSEKAELVQAGLAIAANVYGCKGSWKDLAKSKHLSLFPESGEWIGIWGSSEIAIATYLSQIGHRHPHAWHSPLRSLRDLSFFCSSTVIIATFNFQCLHQVCPSVRARQHSLRQLTRCTLKIIYFTVSNIWVLMALSCNFFQLLFPPTQLRLLRPNSLRISNLSGLGNYSEPKTSPSTAAMSCSLSCVLAGQSWMFYQWIILSKSWGTIESHGTHYGAWWGPRVAIEFYVFLRSWAIQLHFAVEWLLIFQIQEAKRWYLQALSTSNADADRTPIIWVVLCYVWCTYTPKWIEVRGHLRKCDVLAPWFTSISYLRSSHHIITNVHHLKAQKKIHLSPNRVKIIYWC